MGRPHSRLYWHWAQGSRIPKGCPGSASASCPVHPFLWGLGLQRKLSGKPSARGVLQERAARAGGLGCRVSGPSSALVTTWPWCPHEKNGTEDLPRPPLEVPGRTGCRKPQEVIKATHRLWGSPSEQGMTSSWEPWGQCHLHLGRGLVKVAWGPNSAHLAWGENGALMVHRDHGLPSGRARNPRAELGPGAAANPGLWRAGQGLIPQPGLRQNQAPGSQKGLQKGS